MKKFNIKNSALILSLVAFFSAFSFARAKTFKDVVSYVLTDFLKPLGPIILSLAIVYFTWGVIKFIRGDGKDKEEGKQIMFWGIVGLFVMICVWGLVNIVKDTLAL